MQRRRRGLVLAIVGTLGMTCALSGARAEAAASVTIIKPGDGETVSGTVDITLDVQLPPTAFYGTLILGKGLRSYENFPVTTGTYTRTWDTTQVPDGTQPITATVLYFDILTDVPGIGRFSIHAAPHQVMVSNGIVDRTPPVVLILQPQPGTVIQGIVALTALARDEHGVTSVEFFKDGEQTPLGTAMLVGSNTYVFDWDSRTITTGSHSLVAKAIDGYGNAGFSQSVAVIVQKPLDTIPPSVTVVAPLDQAVLPSSSRVLLQAKAVDNVGVQSVSFTVDDQVICSTGVGSNGIYQCNWKTPNNRKATSHHLKVSATDTAGNVAHAVDITVTVKPGG